MIHRTLQYIRNIRVMQRVNFAIARGGASIHLRHLKSDLPTSWEFSGFSQNGEDGIIDYLCSKLNHSNRFFVEIGAADGLENNTSWLAIAKKYSGLMIEGDKKLFHRLATMMPSFNLGVEALNVFVTQENIAEIINNIPYSDPDVFSLDIDGNDYYVLKAFLNGGLKPKIIVVEYNSAFGPDNAITIPYQGQFNYMRAHISGLYYGVSIQAWRKLLKPYGYHFLTVESNGVNAFFIQPDCFSQDILQAQPLMYAENFFQKRKFKLNWQEQYKLIRHLDVEVIS